jgi:hypothetical protein
MARKKAAKKDPLVKMSDVIAALGYLVYEGRFRYYEALDAIAALPKYSE